MLFFCWPRNVIVFYNPYIVLLNWSMNVNAGISQVLSALTRRNPPDRTKPVTRKLISRRCRGIIRSPIMSSYVMLRWKWFSWATSVHISYAKLGQSVIGPWMMPVIEWWSGSLTHFQLEIFLILRDNIHVL